jgi:uncharacterized protein (TIGR02300 family)
MAMATKAARGTKRTCQSSDCGARFYDLARDPISCPICGTVYELAMSAPTPVVTRAQKTAKKPEFVTVIEPKPDELPEGEEALADIETPDEPVAVEDDETFLEEEEEDGGNVSGIVSGPAGPDEET